MVPEAVYGPASIVYEAGYHGVVATALLDVSLRLCGLSWFEGYPFLWADPAAEYTGGSGS
jgi:hypothetical protein